MTGKTKAAMPGRQCNTALQKHRQITRLAAGGQTLSRRNSEPADFIQDFGSSFAFWRWRRLISPFTAVTMNCAFVSPSSRLLSKSATTSCGKRALSCCDLLLVEPVAIPESPCARCDSVYAKKIIVKGLKCDSLACSFKNKGAIHLVSAKPGSASTLTGPLTTKIVNVSRQL